MRRSPSGKTAAAAAGRARPGGPGQGPVLVPFDVGLVTALTT
ncbi:MAG TPA: hypothetical protein VHY31_21115 [Streptosporangiaceae bacterium]|nr:hypothetical protein [Streptosporangiaceae bacterium]